MLGRDRRFILVAAASGLLVLGIFASLMADVGRLYPGFFVSADYRALPLDDEAQAAGVGWGDRLVAVDGASPVGLLRRLDPGGAPVRYTLERDGRRYDVSLTPQRFTWALLARHFAGYFVVSVIMLAAGVAVFRQNPSARPNRNFLLYMCLWAVSNAAVPDATLGLTKRGAVVLGFIPTLLSVHGWVFFLTYPVNAQRQAWLERHHIIPWLYRGALALGAILTGIFMTANLARPELLMGGWLFPAARMLQVVMALVSFPIKILALLDTRQRAASPLVNQQITVLLLGIGLGLGLWLALMLLPLTYFYAPPVNLQIGAALVLLYPAAIAYATVRYRLFDASVVIRRSMVYTALAGVITAAYALAIAAANVVLAQAELARSPWFSAGFMFAVALAFNPLRRRMQAAVDRTFFRDRYDYARTIQSVARSMTGLLDLEEITHRVTETIDATMHVARPRLVVGAPGAGFGGILDLAPGALSRYQVAADPSFASLAPAALEIFRREQAEIIVPLRFQDRLHGVLVLGAKRSEAPYTAEDLALLETLADQTAVAVANAEAHRRVVDYAHQLERSLMIRTSLAKFVPQRVRELIEEDPQARTLAKREADVSVLFADLTGYTRLSARLPQETLDALVERYFGAFLDEIVKHGGDVNETAGDGLMVIFYEGEHARAALDAAQAIHRRARELNTELVAGMEPLAMRIGVNTGPAQLGATKIEGRAGTRWTYTASGLTTNVAARLAAVAEGGDVVLSEYTLARLAVPPPVEDLGLVPLKNVDQPLRLFRLRSAHRAAV
jgi:class 3 adenylate cyclase